MTELTIIVGYSGGLVGAVTFCCDAFALAEIVAYAGGGNDGGRYGGGGGGKNEAPCGMLE